MIHAGLGQAEYVVLCAAVGLAPIEATPLEREAHVLRAITPSAGARYDRWIGAGRPVPSLRDVELRLRYFGASSTLALIRRAITSGRISPAVIAYACDGVRVIALGRDAVGLCIPGPLAQTLSARSSFSTTGQMLRLSRRSCTSLRTAGRSQRCPWM